MFLEAMFAFRFTDGSQRIGEFNKTNYKTLVQANLLWDNWFDRGWNETEFAFDTTEKKICLVATHNNTAELDQDFCVNVQYTHRNDLMDILYIHTAQASASEAVK